MQQEKETMSQQRKRGNVVFLILDIVLLVVSVLLILIPNNQNKTQEAPSGELMDYTQVNKICELATLKCYYHNVAEYEKQPDAIFRNGLFKYGYKKIWLEYSGIIEAGVNASSVVIGEPDDDGVVEVYVPDATVLNVTADKDSIGDPLEETGMFTEISMEEKTNAFSEAQRKMKEEAQKDEVILGRAKENAKELIKQYIVNIGKLTGENYTVRWLKEV